jgi:hypothetical protein
MPVNDLLFEAGMDNINLFKLHRCLTAEQHAHAAHPWLKRVAVSCDARHVRYMEVSQIAKKVLGFAEIHLAEVRGRLDKARGSYSKAPLTTTGRSVD